MGNITLSFTNSQKAKNESHKEKVILTYHEYIPEQKEYYSYIDANGNEKTFNDPSYMISKISSSKTIAKKVSVSKVDLSFVPGKEPSDYQQEYFTYNEGKLFLDKPIYNELENTYIGVFNIVKTYDKEIKLYEEN